ERAPMKQWSSMIVGEACSGSSTPPMPALPDRWQCLPTCAQEPTVAQVSTMVPAPTQAPMLTKLGINTTSLPMNEPRRTSAPGTTRAPSLRSAASSNSAKRAGILSQYRSEEHTSELQSREKLVCRLLLEKKKLAE